MPVLTAVPRPGVAMGSSGPTKNAATMATPSLRMPARTAVFRPGVATAFTEATCKRKIPATSSVMTATTNKRTTVSTIAESLAVAMATSSGSKKPAMMAMWWHKMPARMPASTPVAAMGSCARTLPKVPRVTKPATMAMRLKTMAAPQIA